MTEYKVKEFVEKKGKIPGYFLAEPKEPLKKPILIRYKVPFKILFMQIIIISFCLLLRIMAGICLIGSIFSGWNILGFLCLLFFSLVLSIIFIGKISTCSIFKELKMVIHTKTVDYAWDSKSNNSSQEENSFGHNSVPPSSSNSNAHQPPYNDFKSHTDLISNPNYSFLPYNIHNGFETFSNSNNVNDGVYDLLKNSDDVNHHPACSHLSSNIYHINDDIGGTLNGINNNFYDSSYDFGNSFNSSSTSFHDSFNDSSSSFSSSNSFNDPFDPFSH